MLNILVLDYDFTHSYYKNSVYLWNELKKLTNCVVLTPTQYNPSIKLDDIVDMCPFKPDFIIINEFVNFYHKWSMKGLEKVNIPIGYMPHDIDGSVDIRRKYLHQNKISLLFPLYKNSFLRHYPEFTDKLRWLPHHVNIEMFKDYNLVKDMDALLIGRVKQPFYSLRKKIVQKMNGHPGFVYFVHPSDQTTSKVSLIAVNEYPRLINRSKIFFTCCSTLKYPLLKYFETLGCRTLLLADTCSDLTELGFKPGEHFVEINEHNFYKKFLYYANNEAERNRIATNGYNFIRSRHTTAIRAQQLVSYINAFLGRSG